MSSILSERDQLIRETYFARIWDGLTKRNADLKTRSVEAYKIACTITASSNEEWFNILNAELKKVCKNDGWQWETAMSSEIKTAQHNAKDIGSENFIGKYSEKRRKEFLNQYPNLTYANLMPKPIPQKPQQTQTQSQPAPQPAPIEPQQPQYDTYSPNTKDHEERVKKWMEHIGLGDKAQDMINKYGVELAHKIVQTALMNPSDLTSATDGKWKSSKKTIEYFVNNDISEDKLATIPGVDADFVAQSLASRPRADKRLEIPEELQSHTPTYNIPTIDPTTITINPHVEQHDPRALYVANLKTQLKIDGFTQEEISQAIDKALQSTLEKGIQNDFALGTASQWCGTLRHEMFNALGVHNDLDRPYDYVGKLEQQAHASSLRGNIAKTPHFTEALNLAEATITQHENPSVELSKEPEVLTAENHIEPTVEPVVETERPEIVTTTIDQRKTSGVDEPVIIPEIPGKTWEEIVATTTPKPPANFEEFKKTAWQEFISSEGAILEPYFDCNGHPSIGIGQLIYKRNEIKQSGTCIAGTSLADKQDEIATATTIINDKNAYYMKNGKKVSLYSSARDGTPNITSISGTVTICDSKGNTVEVERIPNAGVKIKKVNDVAIGKISKKESDKMFENRLRADYNRVCKAIPNFKDMPTHVQIATVHMCFGKTSTFCPPTKGVNDYTERSGFKYGEKRTPEELMGYVNKYYKKRGQVNDAIKNDLALANQEVAHINDQLALQNTIDNPNNQQTLIAQNQQQTTTDNSVHILNKLQSGRYS